MKPLLLTLLLTCALAGSALAQISIPAIVTDGLAAFQENGRSAALTAWVKGSSQVSASNNQNKLENILSLTETTYGKMIGYEPIRVVVVTPSLLRVYILIKFETGPLYSSFDCYKSTTGWIIPTMECDMKPEAILPPGIFSAATP